MLAVLRRSVFGPSKNSTLAVSTLKLFPVLLRSPIENGFVMYMQRACRVTTILSLILIVSLSACSQKNADGPKRFRVSGKVTFDGTPLSYGTIVFEPDSSKGNAGPQGIAKVRNGFYDTSIADGKGFVGGPTVVLIEGTTEEFVTEGNTGKFLFSGFKVEKDLPRDVTSVDFEVPKNAGAKDTKSKRSPQ